MKRIILLLVIFILMPATCSLADWIKLKNGDHLTGRIIEDTGEKVKIVTPDGTETIDRADIQWVREDAHHHGGGEK